MEARAVEERDVVAVAAVVMFLEEEKCEVLEGW
jgi:hypothetical protein